MNRDVLVNMKNWPWKRVLIGAAVVSSIAISSSFGTYAYFTSEQNSSTAFAAGKLEIGLGQTQATFKAEDDKPFMPGVRFERDLTVENRSDVPVKYAILASKSSGDDVVYNQLMVEIRSNGGNGDLIYTGKVNQLSEANVVIPSIEKNGESALHFTVYLPESAGNEVQQKKAEVDFGFLATQQENGEYFAQKGPVITLSPQELSSDMKQKAFQALNDKVDGATFILAEGSYNIDDLTHLPKHATWKAEKGKEGKVIIQANGTKVEEVTMDGLKIHGGIQVGSHVSIVNCEFDGGAENIIQTAQATSDSASWEGLTIRKSKFVGGTNAIMLDQAIIGVVIDNNTFEQVNHAVIASDNKKSQLQIMNNDFSKVTDAAVIGGTNRIGDGIEGFKELVESDRRMKKLALHQLNLDVYLQNNQYSTKE
ncbi:TasA family protein [Brevibacillus ginsengisoli]|uniref:TasA family protein n=1 Tax=Brevibacillus ginsengisoli TaxID=363854 RepID=UPI003CF2BCE0